jgi:pilus assembly protein Flp/PilA
VRLNVFETSWVESPSVETHHPGDILMHTVTTLAELLKNEDGATAIEYGLIAALIAVAAVVAMTAVGTNLTALFNSITNSLAP